MGHAKPESMYTTRLVTCLKYSTKGGGELIPVAVFLLSSSSQEDVHISQYWAGSAILKGAQQ